MRKHIAYKCHKHCNGCAYCDGGLFLCTVCGGLEGSLTTECCGRKITEEEEHKIYDEANLDFKDGKWIVGPNHMSKIKGMEKDENPQ